MKLKPKPNKRPPMQPLIDPNLRPGLLVSVRDAREAQAALEGGAHVIDIKEPKRGSLGAADSATIADVVRTIAGRAPVTAAAGELTELLEATQPPMPDGVSYFKIGLAGCGDLPDWQSGWMETISALCPGRDAARHAAAVTYADWRAAAAPPPSDVFRTAADVGCPALLIDTWDKKSGSLFDHWHANDLRSFIKSARSHGIMIVLAGSLAGQNLIDAAKLRPDLIAVRTAACGSDRTGPVSRARVAAVREMIAGAQLISF
jgi:uncharacterized protein (UPF0264 family)